MLQHRKVPVSIATGKETDKKNIEAVGKFTKRETRVLISTFQYIGEGFDDTSINRILILTPIGIKGKTTLVQIVGRAQRVLGEKNAVVYDLVDDEGLLEVQANARVRNLLEEWGKLLEVKRIKWERSRI